MRIRVSDPDLASDLLRFLQRRIDVVGGRIAEDELEVALLGSLHHRHQRLELQARLRLWRETHPDADVEVVD